METKLVMVTLGFNQIVIPSEIAIAMLKHSDAIFKFNPYEKNPKHILDSEKFTIEPLPDNFFEIISGAKAVGSSYSDYKNNSQ